MRAEYFLMILFATVIQGTPRNELWNVRTDSSVDVGVVTLITEEEKERALEALKDPAVGIGRYIIFSSVSDYDLSKSHAGTDCTYESWSSELQRRGIGLPIATCPRLYQALRFGSQISLRALDNGCETTRKVLTAADPENKREGDQVEHLVDLVVAHSPERRLKASITMYFQTDQTPTAARAKRILEKARQLDRGADLTVILRSDSWFPTQCEAPLFPSAALTRA